MTEALIVPAKPAEEQRCIAALVTAFTTDPLIRWLLPDPQRYLVFFPQVLKHFAGRAFAHNSAFRSVDCGAAALWLPTGIGPDEEALGAVMQEAVDPSRHQAVFSLLEQVGASHPNLPHWYLPAIGTDQNRQGQGLGSALLTASLPQCDARHEAAYLEASNPRNIRFYERFGFKVCGEIQAGDSPTIYPMLRPASR